MVNHHKQSETSAEVYKPLLLHHLTLSKIAAVFTTHFELSDVNYQMNYYSHQHLDRPLLSVIESIHSSLLKTLTSMF